MSAIGPGPSPSELRRFCASRSARFSHVAGQNPGTRKDWSCPFYSKDVFKLDLGADKSV